MIAATRIDLSGIQRFLDGFHSSLGYSEYLEDPVLLSDAEQLCKFAGQVCYMSFGPKRTMNEDAFRYLQNIKESKHGSIFEHVQFSFLLYGISRSLSHELVRHRIGVAYSQLSQRYVGGRMLRFVERPEYADDSVLHERFEARIDNAYHEYEGVTDWLAELQSRGGRKILNADQKTDLRKKVRQAARSLLPNETETVMVVSGNIRAWRHFLEMRASEHAEIEIRATAMKIYNCLVQHEPWLFGDYKIVNLPDGTEGLDTPYRKV